MATDIGKNLAVHIGSYQHLISVAPTDNLFDVRSKVLTLTNDVILASWPEFSMSLDDHPLSRKDELSTPAYSVIDERKIVSLHEANKSNETTEKKRVTDVADEKTDHPAKKPRSESNENENGTEQLVEFEPEEGKTDHPSKTPRPHNNEDEANTEDAMKCSEPEEGENTHAIDEDLVDVDDDDKVQVVSTPKNPHAKNELVVSKCKAYLARLRGILNDPANSGFCSNSARQEWSNEINAAINKSPDSVIIGCLGQTGAGKVRLQSTICVILVREIISNTVSFVPIGPVLAA